jgi:gliding motility-associated-like protein
MKLKLFLSFLLVSAGFNVSAQLENHIWCFGDSVVMDFSTNPPSLIAKASLNVATTAYEGSASIADSSGNLLFYSDGMRVFTKNHTLMQNGSGLLGSYSDTQPASIVRKPGSANLYYIFFSSGVSIYRTGGYAIVDMNENNGLGKVIVKNVVFANKVAEGMVVIPHADAGKYWIVYNVLDTALFQAYLFDCSGVSNTPVISAGGVAIQFGLNITNLNVSHDYKKILATATYFDEAFLLNFNNATGVLTPQTTFNLTFPFGCCFSPNNQVVYFTHSFYDQATFLAINSVVQYDISSANNATILASKKILDTIISGSNGELGQIRLAPNNQLYIARFGSQFMPTISNPNSVGLSCNYNRSGFSLAPNIAGLGLPAIAYVSSITKFPNLLSKDTAVCGNQLVLTANYTTGPYLWSNGDTAQSTTVSQNGDYWVSAKVCVTSFSDTIQVNLDSPFDFELTAQPDSNKCFISQTLSPSLIGSAYLWNNADTTKEITVNTNGIYRLQLTKGACTAYDSIDIKISITDNLKLPNVFSPNGDAINDYFEIKDDCYYVNEAQVYNRWGKLMRESQDSNTIWDGKFNGTNAEEGVYFYLLKVVNFDGQQFSVQGNVTLVN